MRVLLLQLQTFVYLIPSFKPKISSCAHASTKTVTQTIHIGFSHRIDTFRIWAHDKCTIYFNVLVPASFPPAILALHKTNFLELTCPQWKVRRAYMRHEFNIRHKLVILGTWSGIYGIATSPHLRWTYHNKYISYVDLRLEAIYEGNLKCQPKFNLALTVGTQRN